MLIVWNVTQNAPLDLSKHGTAWKTDVMTFKFQRRLPCQTCGKSFDRPSLLKRHLRTHTGKNLKKKRIAVCVSSLIFYELSECKSLYFTLRMFNIINISVCLNYLLLNISDINILAATTLHS